MDSRDSGCFNSILSNNTNISNILKSNVSYTESTPIKNEHQTRSAVHSQSFFDSPNSSCLTPIRKGRPSDAHAQSSIDLDSVYFTQLKRYKQSSQFSPRTCSPSVSSFGQRLRLSSNLQYTHNDTSYSSESSSLNLKIDVLTELTERSMFHVTKKILGYLPNKDYVRVSQVSKNWLSIYNYDLNSNKQRKNSLKLEKEFHESEKENICVQILAKNLLFYDEKSLDESLNETDAKNKNNNNNNNESFMEVILVEDIEETKCADKSFNKLGSKKSRKNLKRL